MSAEAKHLERLEQVAWSFQPASQTLTNARVLQKRRAWKYLLHTVDLADLIVELRDTHHILLAGNEALAHYENHYFDTEDRTSYRDHLRGRPRRHKVRVRSYVDRGLTTLEVKLRSPRGESDKKRLIRTFQDRSLDKEAAQFILDTAPVSPDELRPSLMNQFRRITLLGVDSEERVTVDVGLRFQENGKEINLLGVGIIEVKSAARRCDTVAIRLFRSRRLRSRSMSKYCVGSALLNPELAANRFLPLLRDIKKMESYTCSA